jgi:hypothetical protein
VRLGDRPIIETKHSLNKRTQFLWNPHIPDSATIRPLRVLVDLQIDAEGFAEVSDCTRQHDAPSGGTLSNDRQIVLLGELAHAGQILGIGAVELFEVLMCYSKYRRGPAGG